jgi:hypothetical protein
MFLESLLWYIINFVSKIFYSADSSTNLMKPFFSSSLMLQKNKLVCMFLASLLRFRINYGVKVFTALTLAPIL